VNKHLYLCHLLVLSSPMLMMQGHTNLKHRELIDYSHNGNGIDNNKQGIKFLSPRKCML